MSVNLSRWICRCASSSSLDVVTVGAKDVLRVVARLDLEEAVKIDAVVGGRPCVEVGVGEVGKDAAGAVSMRQRPRACEPGVCVVAVVARGGGIEADGVLE